MNVLEWKAEVKKQLTLRGETLKDVAEALNWTYGYARQIASYRKDAPGAVRKLSEYLGIEPYTR